MRVPDLGCGTGELTKYLHSAVAARESVGDVPENMLAKADGSEGNGWFELADRGGPGQEIDLVFSNAAVGDGTRGPFERFLVRLQPGDRLRTSPAMEEEAVHVLAAETAREFSEALRGMCSS